MKKITLIIFPLLMAFLLASCAEKYPLQPKSDIKGRFVFQGIRDLKESWAGYILKDRKITLLDKNIACPKWSPNGKYIAYARLGGLAICSYPSMSKELIEIPHRVGQLAWTPDGKSVVYVTKDGIYKNAYIRFYQYNILTKKHSLIKDFGKGHAILELSVSKNNMLLFFDNLADAFNALAGGIYLMDLDGENLKLVRKSAMHSSWFPDGKHIGFFTNRSDDGTRINDRCGGYFKMNIDTGKMTLIRELKSSDWNRKISSDGKYLYYSKSYKKDGRYLVVSPIDNPEVEIPVTKSVEMKPGNYSQDMDADWYQGE